MTKERISVPSLCFVADLFSFLQFACKYFDYALKKADTHVYVDSGFDIDQGYIHL